LITRKPDPDHGRILKAKLTKKGLATTKKAYKLVHDAEDKMLKKIPIKKQALLEELLITCIENLN